MAAEAQQQIDELVAARSREISAIHSKYFSQIKELAVARAAKIRRIPGFWRVVFARHPLIRDFTTEKDWEILESLDDVSVDEFGNRDGSKTMKLVLELGRNQFVTNASLWVTVTDGLPRGITSSGVSFKPRYSFDWLDSLPAETERKMSLFRLFESEDQRETSSQPDPMRAEQIFELAYTVKTDIWEDPFKYYELDSVAGTE